MQKAKSIFAIAFVLMLALPIVAAQSFSLSFDTVGYLSVSPKTIGVNQQLLVNLWVHPQPSGPAPPTTGMINQSYTGISVTFTRPDGTKDSFMPTEPGSGLPPGAAEMTGAIWFYYTPTQVGTWDVQFNFPGNTFTNQYGSVYFEPCTSQRVSFTVQKDPVTVWLPPAELPGPNDYWESPVSPNNREWSQISGPWLQPAFDRGGSCFNQYSTSPSTAHILWKQKISDAGIIGGEWGSMSYTAGSASPPVIMLGKIYYNIAGGMFRCQDLRTGEILWQASGSISMAQNLVQVDQFATTYSTFVIQTNRQTPSLYLIGLNLNTWTFYDPYTGRLLRTITNVPDQPPDEAFGGRAIVSKWRDGSPIVYCLRFAGWSSQTLDYKFYEAYKWDFTKVTGNNWTTGIVWKRDLKIPGSRAPGEARGHVLGGLQVDEINGVGVYYTYNENVMAAIDLNTGADKWNISFDYINTAYGQMGIDGNVLTFDHIHSKVLAYDTKTGTKLWESEALPYPWGSHTRVRGCTAYGATYVYSYTGNLFALDVNTGKTKWVSDSAGATTEVPYGTWALYLGPIIADGKIYIGTSEHSPTEPLPRGNRLICFDAFTGKQIWNVSGAINPTAIAEGYLSGVNEYDGYLYVFGKGKTETSVTATPKVTAKGSNVLIEGTVLDMSPAQVGTPAIADGDMSAWMNYKHMQRLTPGTTADNDLWGTDVEVTGVPVKLTAIKADGSSIDVGTVISDGEGLFKKMWTLPDTGEYTIVASFEGSGAYWPSKAETALGGTAAASSSPTPTGATVPEAGAETVPVALYIGVASIAIMAIIVVAALMLKRRK